VRSRIRAPQAAVDDVIDGLVRSGEVVAEQGGLRASGFSAAMTDRQRRVAKTIMDRLGEAGAEPPTLDELGILVDVPLNELTPICRALAREGSLIAVEPNRYYSGTTVSGLTGKLLAGMSADADYGPADLRDFLGLTRKFLIPFLEYCDREGYTIRDGVGRRRRGTFLAKDAPSRSP
jgi:selenocysteine-specific elongation factor